VVSIDQGADLAVLYFPDYFNQDDIPWAPIATDLPQNGEIFLAIGYPNQATENVDQGGKAYRLYNYGTIEATLGYDVLPVNQQDPRYAAYSGNPDAQDWLIANAENMQQSGHPFLVMNSGIYYGNSGGAIFSRTGELVAVASRKEFPTSRAYGTSVVSHPLEIYEVETVLDDIAGLQEDPDTYLDMLATVRAEVEQQFLVAISDRIESYGAGVQGIFLEDFEAAELEVAELLSFREIPPHVLRMVLLQICFDSKIEIVP